MLFVPLVNNCICLFL